MVEDTYYLTEFARVLSILASKAPRDEWIVAFDRDAIGSLEAERALHESYFKDFGLSEEELRSRPPAPTSLAYTSYLLATAHSRSFRRGAERDPSLLLDLSSRWERRSRARARRILCISAGSTTTGATPTKRMVEAVLGIMDESAKDEGPGARSRMVRHFVTTSRYEWMFWDMGYRQEAWPV